MMPSIDPEAPPESGSAPRKRRILPSRWQAIGAFLTAVALLAAIDAFFLESVVVPSSSMRPTILPNERLLVQKWPPREIRRFDVVVIRSGVLHQRIAKRVIGLPSDRIILEEGWRVRLNGKLLDYSAAADPSLWTEAGHHAIRVQRDAGQVAVPVRFGQEEIVLGADEYFVLGDNRLASEDSRLIGPIRRSEVEGFARVAWYSYDLQEHRWRWDRLLRIVQ
jgi:signal peptidase I